MPALALQTVVHGLRGKAHFYIASKNFKPLRAASAGNLIPVGRKSLHASRSRNRQQLAFSRIHTTRKGVIGKGIADLHCGTARHQGGKQGDCKDDKRAQHGYNLLLPARNARNQPKYTSPSAAC